MSNQEKLPPDWTSRIDPRYNRVYYYNKKTKESSWVKPEFIKEKHSINDNDDDDDNNNDEKQFVTEDGVAWTKVFSTTHSRFYFYDKSTGNTTWTDPRKKKNGKSTTGRSSSVVKSRVNSESKTRQSSTRRGTERNGGYYSSEEDDEEEQDHFNTSSISQSREKSNPFADDPDLFQTKIMEQFPALKQAFQALEEGQKQLQREREEHQARMKAEMDLINAKLEELRLANEKANSPTKNTVATLSSSSGSEEVIDATTTPSAGQPSKQQQKFHALDRELKRYSVDLERRSISVVEKRKSLAHQSGLVKMSDLKSVIDEANRLAAERGNAPATSESASNQMRNISEKFSSSSQQDGEDDEMTEIVSEMDGVAKGLEYAMKEAAAQSEAAEMAKAVGEETDYYELLEVTEKFTEAELKKAYRKKLIQWHPDKVKPGLRAEAEKMTDIVQTAFKVLGDPWERDIYDWFGLEQYLLHVKVIQCFKNYLIAGMELIKHPRKGRPRKRVVWLDADCTEIKSYRKKVMEDLKSGKEKIKGVPIKSITDVKLGRSTDVLKRTGRSSHANRYFSIVCADRTLDFECASEASCEFISTRMKLLIIDLKRDKDWMDRHYNELDGGGSQ